MDKDTKEKISRLTRREFADDEIYTFPETLCDNEIDRDGERFSDDALEKLAELFVGKTIVIDHDASAANQIARVYDTEVITDAARLTKYGAPYRYVKGLAYMVRTADNADTITRIDGGILKEMSVSCSAERKICSVCGKNLFGEPCAHQKGETYDGAVCHHILDGITDAYELSFVAVPAQPGAGVTKHYTQSKGGHTMAEFTPITTQAEFDAACKPLIDAAVAEAVKQFEGWLSPEDHQKAIDALTAENTEKLFGAYRAKAAALTGLPAELAARLTGDSEEAIQKDAELLASLTKSHGTPHFEGGGEPENGVEKAFYAKNPELRKE